MVKCRLLTEVGIPNRFHFSNGILPEARIRQYPTLLYLLSTSPLTGVLHAQMKRNPLYILNITETLYDCGVERLLQTTS